MRIARDTSSDKELSRYWPAWMRAHFCLLPNDSFGDFDYILRKSPSTHFPSSSVLLGFNYPGIGQIEGRLGHAIWDVTESAESKVRVKLRSRLCT